MESWHSSSNASSAETHDYRDAHVRAEFVMSDPVVRRLRQEIEEYEFHLGMQMSDTYRAEAERWQRALREGDAELYVQICPGKHGGHGRICLLDRGHDADGGPHWGRTADGRPVAWLGSARDDD